MITWDNAIKNGLYAYVHRDQYAYFYGAKGQKLTDAVMDALIAAEPAHFARYTAQQIQEIRDYSRGKTGYDCSGFTGWVCTGDKRYSTGQIENCTSITQDLVAGVAGSLLYKSSSGRHIGIDIGYGYFLHMPTEMHTIELGKISEYNWELSGKSAVVDYTGADNR